jgi:predicted phosphoribosyltransferase
MTFIDRNDAGRKLANALAQYRGRKDATVIALPRGGVVVGAEVARELALPLDIVVPRKIGAPGNEEYAIGAITEAGEPVWDHQAVSLTDASEEYRAQTVERERAEARRRLTTYRGDRPPRDLKGKMVILVDDGIATGFTMRAAIQTIRAEGAKRIVLAVPVAAADSIAKLRHELNLSPSQSGGAGGGAAKHADGAGAALPLPPAGGAGGGSREARGGAGTDEIVVLHAPEWFGAVGAFYDVFDQTNDDEVIALLAKGGRGRRGDKGSTGENEK